MVLFVIIYCCMFNRFLLQPFEGKYRSATARFVLFYISISHTRQEVHAHLQVQWTCESLSLLQFDHALGPAVKRQFVNKSDLPKKKKLPDANMLLLTCFTRLANLTQKLNQVRQNWNKIRSTFKPSFNY